MGRAAAGASAKAKAKPQAEKRTLETYNAKRRFNETPEPKGKVGKKPARKAAEPGIGMFVVQKHDASRLHYDFRLELDGVLLSWAVTRGPSLNTSDKRLAVRTEDHPLEYGGFEGIIPKGNYGAGTVMVWDTGRWEPIGDPHEELAKGKIAFNLYGQKMRGRWALVLMRKASEKRENWLLIKERDEEASETRDLVAEEPDSVSSGRGLDAIAAEGGIWRSGEHGGKDPKAARAKRGKRPSFIEPQLATLVDAPPEGDGWLFEVKFDGYRTEIAASGDDVRAYTRSGLDWTDHFPNVIAAAKSLDLDGVLLDGEIVALDPDGRSNFGALQNALQSGRQDLVYYVFDLLREGRTDWRTKPLLDRKARLAEILEAAKKDGVLVYSDHIDGNGAAMLEMARGKGLEGIIGKRADRPYRSGRGEAWVKVKVAHRQEFIVLGYRPSEKARHFSSLILGVREDGKLRYAGRVGSGFSQATLAELGGIFDKTAIGKPPAIDIPREIIREAKWVKPELVVEIAFNGWTRDNQIRQGHFMGVRSDKRAREVVREEPVKPETPPSKDEFHGVRLTHPDKVLFPDSGITKRDLAHYLEVASARIMPYAAGRLISLVRCPEGIDHEAFFQRHPGRGMDEAWKHEAVKTTHGSEEYLYFNDARAVVAAAQMSVIEFHIWGSQLKTLEKPDRIVFDLDPDEGLGFAKVRDAAFAMRDVLDALGLRSLPLLSGGKGVHVVVPIRPQQDWPIVKSFAADLVARMVEAQPDLYVGTMSKAKRKGRLFIDHFRNERGSTAIAPFSPRARAGAPVAWPVRWDELRTIEAANIMTLPKAIDQVAKADAWDGEDAAPQSLTKAVIAAVTR
ncbi:MAG: DNA ligase D [Proteobacteria bacterium]|nr:DNA ligase D [Pseudomonadota bacterium]